MDLRILVVVAVGGCAAPSNDGALEASTASDVTELARSVDAATIGLDGAALQLDATGQVAGVGDCSWTWTVAGPPAQAAYDAGIDATPCGGSLSGSWGSVDYAVQDGTLTGTVGVSSGLWSYDLSGSRTADTTVTSARRGTTETYQGQWTLESLVGNTDGQSPGPFQASLTYQGWFGGDWSLDWSRAADGAVDGTLTGPRGSSCTVTGTTEAVTVTCDSAVR